jgi:ABC-type phosphate/phosphonate transport system substrate-binding protein
VVLSERSGAQPAAHFLWAANFHRTRRIVAQTRQVWKSPLIASDPLVWRKDLAPELESSLAGMCELGIP